MKIDLSKYPPGTKLKLNSGEIVFLIGKCHTKDHESDYVIEHNGWQGLGYRRQDGTHPLCEPQYIESVIQPDKYLVSYKDQSDTVRTIVVVDPQSLTIDSFYEYIKSVTSGYSQPYDILSWSKLKNNTYAIYFTNDRTNPFYCRISKRRIVLRITRFRYINSRYSYFTFCRRSI